MLFDVGVSTQPLYSGEDHCDSSFHIMSNPDRTQVETPEVQIIHDKGLSSGAVNFFHVWVKQLLVDWLYLWFHSEMTNLPSRT